MGWWGSDRDGRDEGTGQEQDDFAHRRAALIDGLRQREAISDQGLDALGAVPRHEFVPEHHRDNAYVDRPLPIGEGQTISAPHMVAIMVDRLDLEPGHEVLEIGTGCGYHAAVTAEVVGAANVYSVEYHATLAEQSRDRLDRLGYGDVTITIGDGHDGWPAHAPYDRAYLTAAAANVPDAVLDQLRPGGIFLGPVGTKRQHLVRVQTLADGSNEREQLGGVRFVRMQGGDD